MEINEPFSETSAESHFAERWGLIYGDDLREQPQNPLRRGRLKPVWKTSRWGSPQTSSPAVAVGFAAESVYIDYSTEMGDYDVRFEETERKIRLKGLIPMSDKVCSENKFYWEV